MLFASKAYRSAQFAVFEASIRLCARIALQNKRFHASELSMPGYSEHRGSAVGDSIMYDFGYIPCRMIFTKYSRFKNSEHLCAAFLGVDFFPGKAVYTRQKELGWDEAGTPSSEK